MRRKVSFFEEGGHIVYRAHVWNERGYSSKTFASLAEANHWMPRAAAMKGGR